MANTLPYFRKYSIRAPEGAVVLCALSCPVNGLKPAKVLVRGDLRNKFSLIGGKPLKNTEQARMLLSARGSPLLPMHLVRILLTPSYLFGVSMLINYYFQVSFNFKVIKYVDIKY